LNDHELLTVAELATAWRRSGGFIRKLIRTGKLPVVNLDDPPNRPSYAKGRRDYRIRPCDAQAFIDAKTSRVEPLPRPTVRRPMPRVEAPKVGWDGVKRLRGYYDQPLWDGQDRCATPAKKGKPKP
jgi:hypothetical protein